MLLSEYFTNNDVAMEKYLQLAACNYDTRPYLFDMVRFVVAVAGALFISFAYLLVSDVATVLPESQHHY
jgi:hypothetical protein